MPLSKVRDRARKRKERAKVRLDGNNAHRNVQPKPIEEPLIDADGNAIPLYD